MAWITHWKAAVFLDAVDVSSKLNGSIIIEREEGVASIARFTLEPAAGAIDPTSWVGSTVQIDFIELDASGATVNTWTIYNGVVDLPTYDPITRDVEMRCTDQLQEVVEQTARASLDTLIGGYHSTDLFPVTDDNWRYALQRLDTVPKSMDLSIGGTLRVTNWAAGAAAATFTDDDVVDGSVRVRLAPRNQIHNKEVITVEYQYETLRHREASWAWTYGRTLCEYLEQPSTLPTIDMARSAAEGTRWLVVSETYDKLWADFVGLCGAENVSWVNRQEELIIGASFTLAKQWTHTITEKYTITIAAPESSGVIGEIPVPVSVGVGVPFDWEEFEAEPEKDDSTDSCSTRVTQDAVLSVSGQQYVGATGQFSEPAGSALDGWGDYVLPVTDEARRLEALNAVMGRANTSILADHRRNRVTFTTGMEPTRDLNETLRINSSVAQATGKVFSLQHSMNLESGAHATEITLSVSRRYGTGITPDALTAPASPSIEPTVNKDNTWLNTAVDTHLGGDTGAPAFDPCWEGYTGNYLSAAPFSDVNSWGDPVEADTHPDPAAAVYPIRMRVTMDQIETEVRDAYEAPVTASYNIAIPNDELVLP